MKITTAVEMRAIDRASSERYGVPSLTLMENAGAAVAKLVRRYGESAHRVVIVCGKGNNGGDGFVAARHLHLAGREVKVLLLADPAELQGDAAAMYGKLPMEASVVASEKDLPALQQALAGADLIVDALLGTGFRPPVTGLMADAIMAINSAQAPVLAVDIPSGTAADAMAPALELATRADAVMTFTAPRPAHLFGELTRGPVFVAQIGSPDEAIESTLGLEVITAHSVAMLLEPRAMDSNKGKFGHVLVVGGALGKAGAAAMAGMGALRAGAGLVTVATPRSVLNVVSSFAPELMTEPLAETQRGSISLDALDRDQFTRLCAGKTVLALGPGIGHQQETVQFARAVVKNVTLPLVIDADGLNAFEAKTAELKGNGRTLVITPHPGEMARLTGLTVAEVQRDRIAVARAFARDHACIVVLKGHRTLVGLPDGRVLVNPTGNPGMATGGTGDILTGLVAGMLAQFPTQPEKAVAAAVYLHGMAGDSGRDALGEQCLIATDLLQSLPQAMAKMRHWAVDEFQRIG
jgi:NAD(P)H-hydrate epimerase